MKKNGFLSKVNSVPKGLQNLLGNVNQGINPSELDPLIKPNIDLYPHWGADRLSTAYNSSNILVVTGGNVNITVPSGQLWQLVGISAHLETVTTATDDCEFSVGILEPGGTRPTRLFYMLANAMDTAAGEFHVCGGPLPDRFLLPSGWQIRANIENARISTARELQVKATYILVKD